MKLILTTDVASLGATGDLVEVKDGYGRNFLLPRGLAMRATRGAMKQVDTIRRAQQTRRIRDLDHAKEVKATLIQLGTITVLGKAAAGSQKLFGSITTAEIAAAVKAAGGPLLDKRSIQVDGHIKTIGDHRIKVRLHPEISVDVNLAVTTD